MSKDTNIDYEALEDTMRQWETLKKTLENCKIKSAPKGCYSNTQKNPMDIDAARAKLKETLDFNFRILPDIRACCNDPNYQIKIYYGRKGDDKTVTAEEANFNRVQDREITYDDKRQPHDTVYGYRYEDDSQRPVYGSIYYEPAPPVEELMKSLASRSVSGNGDKNKYTEPLSRAKTSPIYARGYKVKEGTESDKQLVTNIINTIKDGSSLCKEIHEFRKDYNNKIDDIIEAVNTEYENLLNIKNAYKNFEAESRNKFKGSKGKKYNKNRIADAAALMVAKYGEKKAKKKIKKILEKTGSKLSASKVISLYTKKYKDGKKLKGNVTFGKTTGDNPGSNQTETTTTTTTTTTAAATGAHVVTAKAKKKITKKKSSTSNVVVGATALAATRTGLKAEIKDIKADATTQISNAQITAGDKKKELEIEKNEKIAAVNQKAKEEIDAINPEDENAQQKIDEIKENAQQEVEEINKEYNQNIAQIDEDLNKEVKTIEEHRDTAVKDLNNELNNLKSDKKATTVVEQKVESSAKVTTAAATSKIAQSDVTDSNEKMMNVTGELSDTYEEKSAAIQEYVSNSESNNTSSSDTSSETTPVSTPTNTSDTNTNVAEESVASPTSTQSSSENTSSEPTYTSSNYSSEDNYVTNDGMREDVVEPVTESTTETSTDTGVDQSNVKPIPKTDSTTSTTTGKDTDDTISIAGSDDTDSKKGSSGSGLGTVIPVGLGIAATGAAAVAGVRYVKNRKQNEDMDETYDDENNDLDDSSSEYEDIPSDSAYMRDDYLGPEGSTYTEVPDENSYTDAEELEEAAGINDFSEDAALNDLN